MTSGNIAQALTDTTADRPEAVAMIVGKRGAYRKLTFRELLAATDAFAHGLQASGVGKGDRVVLMVKPSPEFISLTFALFKIGAVVILIDPGMGYRNLLRCIGSVMPNVFIGIPRAQVFKRLFPKPFRTVKIDICVGFGGGLLGKSLAAIADFSKGEFSCAVTSRKELAAVIFTTGSTGPPKGVRYEHGMFYAQLELIRRYYQIGPGEIDQPAFPLFALFSTALGACAVVPQMNPAHPARVNPEKFVKTILDHKVTYSFGSPAIWNVVSRYCLARGIQLPSLKKVLMAGAPVSGELIARVRKIMAAAGDVHVPYGATESLPIVSMTGTEILAETWEETVKGKGACVGRPLPGITVSIIGISNAPIEKWEDAIVLPAGEIGEIVVKGEVVTRSYDRNDKENRLAKIRDDGSFWHRLGDVGYFDDRGRLWFCGRKAHRVVTENGTMFTIRCEAVFNEHPGVRRSALVGVGAAGKQLPVVIIEPERKIRDRQKFFGELRKIAEQYSHTERINTFLTHPSFPVDIRHNAKIFREKLALWAAEQLRA